MYHTNTPTIADLRVRPIMSAEDEEEFINQFMWLILDNSGSMGKLEDAVYEQLQSILKGLASANKASMDVRIRVKLALFNSDIKSFNDTHLDPEQLADTFTREDYTCGGTTSAAAVYKYLDKELSRSNPVVRTLKKNTPGFIFTLITDAQVNDAAALREEARKLLASNRFYKDYCKVLVIFLGDEKHKASAVALADGKEDCVITLEDSLTNLLSPLIISSTVTFGDGTHINSTGERGLSDLAEDARKRTAEGSRSAEDMVDDDLAKMFADLMGKT